MLTPSQAPVRGIIELSVVQVLNLDTGNLSGVVIVPMDPNFGAEKYAVIRFALGKRAGAYLQATITNAAAINDTTKQERDLQLKGKECRLKL